MEGNHGTIHVIGYCMGKAYKNNLNRTISILIRVVSFGKSFITLYNYISE